MNGEQLADRVARLESERDIASLMATYTRLVDAGPDADALAALFTDDAVYETFGHLALEPGSTGPIAGREAIRATFQSLPAMLSFTVHYLCNADITVGPDGSTAAGRWAALELANVEHEGERVPLVLIADYHNDFVREADGWRIQRIRFGDTRCFRYEDGFAHTRYVSMYDLASVTD